MATNNYGTLTTIGEYTQASLFHSVHSICGQSLLYSRIGVDHPIDGEGCSIRMTRPSTSLATFPVLGIIPAAVGMLAAAIELVASPIIILVCLPFCWTDTGRAGLRMGAESLLSGSVMLLAYPLMVLYGNTIGWVACCCNYCLASETVLD